MLFISQQFYINIRCHIVFMIRIKIKSSCYIIDWICIFFILSLNISFNTFSTGRCRQWCFAWFLWEFRVFQHHTPLPRRPYQRWSISDTPYRSWNIGKKKKRKLNWLFIYLDNYWPFICAFDWLLQTTNQMCGSVYLGDLRGY